MLITDYSDQEFINQSAHTRHPALDAGSIPSLSELLTAGMIFILPIIFLLLVSTS